ncbi:FecR family protein [Halalkalibaculum sp. DA384]|uniref:FecR family protein n=1 Tax=Halalkalibaculum sp. DA384 TaxID=3373606 RepID=UPI003754206D
MTDHTGHNKTNKREVEKLLNQFPADKKDLAKKIWEESPRAAPEYAAITGEETEQALNNVHERLPDFSSDSPNNGSSISPAWRWMAAAAVLFLALGAGWLFIPKTASAPYGELASVMLPDGSTIDLNSGTHITYNRLFGITHRDIDLEGEAYFIVEDGDHPFVVNTATSTIQVTGTEFNVRSWSEDPGGETEVTVSEGSVQFFPAEEPDSFVTINPGQLSRFAARWNRPTPPESVAVDRFLGWRNNKLIFNNKTLGVIFRELERRFDVVIDLQAVEVANETLTTYYANPKDIEPILADICRVKGLRYAQTANGYRVY